MDSDWFTLGDFPVGKLQLSEAPGTSQICDLLQTGKVIRIMLFPEQEPKENTTALYSDL